MHFGTRHGSRTLPCRALELPGFKGSPCQPCGINMMPAEFMADFWAILAKSAEFLENSFFFHADFT
jgi:hypothetical protein